MARIKFTKAALDALPPLNTGARATYHDTHTTGLQIRITSNGANPAKGIKRNAERSRDRFIQSDELPRFFAALAEEPNATIRDYILLSLLTGARRGKAPPPWNCCIMRSLLSRRSQYSKSFQACISCQTSPSGSVPSCMTISINEGNHHET